MCSGVSGTVVLTKAEEQVGTSEAMKHVGSDDENPLRETGSLVWAIFKSSLFILVPSDSSFQQSVLTFVSGGDDFLREWDVSVFVSSRALLGSIAAERGIRRLRCGLSASILASAAVYSTLRETG